MHLYNKRKEHSDMEASQRPNNFPPALWYEPWMNCALWSLFSYCNSESTASSGPREMPFCQSPHGASPVGSCLQSAEMTESCVHLLTHCELLEAGT